MALSVADSNQKKNKEANDTTSTSKLQDSSSELVAVTIRKPREEVFQFFRHFENFPQFMKGVKNVEITSPTRSHWVVETSSGIKAEWDAEITAEKKNEALAWESSEASTVKTSGSVEFFTLNGKGTKVTLKMNYEIPGGKLAELLATLSADDPQSLALINLRRLKALLETGVVPTIEGQPSGREKSSETITQH